MFMLFEKLTADQLNGGTRNLLILASIQNHEMQYIKYVIILSVVMTACGQLSLDRPLGQSGDGHL
jgi:hypothetical protein